MSTVYKGRMTAEIEGDFVVFLIGFRINQPWKVHKWLPVFRAMPRMLSELSSAPDSGFLGYTMPPIPTMMVQYWRSFGHLETYARSHDHEHWPAWVAFNRRVQATSGDVGIWHETYRVGAGQWEAIYGGMPAIGLGQATSVVPIVPRRESARQRLETTAAEGLVAVAPVPGASTGLTDPTTAAVIG